MLCGGKQGKTLSPNISEITAIWRRGEGGKRGERGVFLHIRKHKISLPAPDC